MLLLTLPLSGLGKTVPFLRAAYGWENLTPEEIMKNPIPRAFDQECGRCHTRYIASQGVGDRPPDRWIQLVQPMAWAGNITRENCRGALASLLVPLVGKEPDSGASQTPTIQNESGPPSIYCVRCHSQKRILKAKKTPEEWRKTVARMQLHSQELEDGKPITNENAEKVIQFLTNPQP